MAANFRYHEQFASLSVSRHDVFLSHSGVQKPFVTKLYEQLQTHYSIFFDITDHSLPLAEDFPSHIFGAARRCKLAVVVLSEEFLRSKWPMLELCAFFEATPPPKILPLFFKLSPNDLKDKQKEETWRSIWDALAKEDPRIDVSEWVSALQKLASFDGIPMKHSEEESSYIERVFSRICDNVPPSMRHDYSGFVGIHRMSQVVLTEFEVLDVDQLKVCVLGMYGPPGSGKSTLCRYLCEYLFTQFSGKVFHLELPTDADDENFLLKLKELLKERTNLKNKMPLSDISHRGLAYQLWEGTDFSDSRVFLVVDNITCQASQKFMKELLRSDFAVGSKVLMVARDLYVLRPLLQGQELQQNSHYVYSSMSAPSLSSEEALQVLLQFGDGMGLADAHVRETSWTSWHRQVIEQVVDESSVGGRHFPSILKIVGDHLKGLESVDVKNWSGKMKTSFLGGVVMCKQKGLKQLVNERFRALSKNLQTLFLDVGLFIVPLSHYIDWKGAVEDEVYLRLSAMQDPQQESVNLKMYELQRHGFLNLWKGEHLTPIVTVHDFYLEFAASIKEASNYFWSNKGIGMARTKELRTVVLELDERQENYKCGPEYMSVKAMVLRNCKSLKVLCGTENLTSLASLEIHNCPSLKWVQLPAVGWKMHNLQMVSWQNTGCDAETSQQQNLNALSISWKPIVNEFRECFPGMGFGGRPVMGKDGLLLRAKGLEVLRLGNTGIRHFVNLSGCLPQLRVLEVRERNLKGLRVCNLPNLERFLYSGDVGTLTDGDPWASRYFHEMSVSSVPRTGILIQRGLLEGCPKLQDVYIQCASLKDERQGISIASSHLRELCVNRLWNVSRPPDLTAAAESLKVLMFRDCRELASLKFGCTYGNLRTLCLSDCPNATELTGLDGLPGLHELHITECAGLEKLVGLGGLASLTVFEMSGCPNLHFHSWLHDLGSLTEVEEIKYFGPGLMDELFDVGGSMKLRNLQLLSSDSAMTAGMLKIPNSLQELSLTEIEEQSTALPVHATTLLGLAKPPQPSFCSISSLGLWGLRNLTSLKGIGFLGLLERLILQGLRNLTSLQGVESLRNLYCLEMGSCSSVEEMPSLSALGRLNKLWCADCVKLRSVEGCGGLSSLESVVFSGCKSLARLPLWDLKDWKGIWRLEIEGSKFASVEAAMAWVEDEQAPEALRMASVNALRWELLDCRRTACEMMLDRLLSKMANRCDTEDNPDAYPHHLFESYYLAVLKTWNLGCSDRSADRVPDIWNDDDLEPEVPFPFDSFRGLCELADRHHKATVYLFFPYANLNIHLCNASGQPLAHHLPHMSAQGSQVGFQPTTSLTQAEPSTVRITPLGRSTELLRRLEEAYCLAKSTNRQLVDQCPDTPHFSIFVAYLFYCVPFFDKLFHLYPWSSKCR